MWGINGTKGMENEEDVVNRLGDVRGWDSGKVFKGWMGRKVVYERGE